MTELKAVTKAWGDYTLITLLIKTTTIGTINMHKYIYYRNRHTRSQTHTTTLCQPHTLYTGQYLRYSGAEEMIFYIGMPDREGKLIPSQWHMHMIPTYKLAYDNVYNLYIIVCHIHLHMFFPRSKQSCMHRHLYTII